MNNADSRALPGSRFPRLASWALIALQVLIPLTLLSGLVVLDLRMEQQDANSPPRQKRADTDRSATARRAEAKKNQSTGQAAKKAGNSPQPSSSQVSNAQVQHGLAPDPRAQLFNPYDWRVEAYREPFNFAIGVPFMNIGWRYGSTVFFDNVRAYPLGAGIGADDWIEGPRLPSNVQLGLPGWYVHEQAEHAVTDWGLRSEARLLAYPQSGDRQAYESTAVTSGIDCDEPQKTSC